MKKSILVLTSIGLFMLAGVNVRAEGSAEEEIVSWYRHSFEVPIVKERSLLALQNHYASPLRYLDLDGEIFLPDEESVKNFLTGFAAWLDESKSSGAEMVAIQVKILNSSAVLLVADWRWFGPDGKVLTDCDPVQYFYVLSKREPGWKVVSETAVDCGKNLVLK